MEKSYLTIVALAVCLLFWAIFWPVSWELVLRRKLSVKSGLRTATREYGYRGDGTTPSGYKECTMNCSWEVYMPNDEFQAKTAFREPFSIEDDQKLALLREQLACVPFSFGYSQEKSDLLFPPYIYPPCSSQSLKPCPEIHLGNGTFSMSCLEGQTGEYVLHPDGVGLTEQYFDYELSEYWEKKQYTGNQVEGVIGEFAIAGCSSKLTQAELLPTLLPHAYQRASVEMKRRAQGKQIRPVSIIFLAIDSFSRRHFYRKLNETVKVMNELNAEKQFAVFDFKLHNVMGNNSPKNMVPMFSNRTEKFYKKPKLRDYLGSHSLWAIAKEWGFVTFLGFEYCGSNFINYMGKRLDVDHHVSTFYCAAKDFMGTDMGKDSKMQRCIGPHMSHYYLLNYTHAFSSMYRGLNQFMYVHVEAAHEDTGQHAQTLDADLALFLKRYTEDFGKDSDIAIMIQGDHGLGYGDWHKDIEADQEYKLPAMFLVASTELLERIPSSFDALWHNTFRLVSKRDFRATVLSLFGEPYGGTYPVHEEQYLQDAFILTREKVKDSRVCNDTHIEPWLCSCLEPTEEIPPEVIHSFGLSPLENLLSRIISEALRLANERVFTSSTFPSDFFCRKLSFDEITRAYGYKINNKIEQIKVEFTINELPAARIETTALVGSDVEQALFHRDANWYPLDPYTYIGFQTNIRVIPTQIIDISRKDKYSGPCEALSRANSVDGEFCVCKDLEDISRMYPSLADS